LGVTALGVAIKVGTAAWSAYKIVAGSIAAINAGIAASNTAIAATATTATAATTALTTALRVAAGAAAVGAVLTIPGSSPIEGAVPSTMPKPAPIGRTPVVPPQKPAGIPGFGAPLPIPASPTAGKPAGATVNTNINVNVKNSNSSASEIAKEINKVSRNLGTNAIRNLKYG